MKVHELLRAAAEMPAGTSERGVTIALADKLNRRHAPDTITYKAVSKWMERGSIPGKWLMRLVALPKRALDMTDFA